MYTSVSPMAGGAILYVSVSYASRWPSFCDSDRYRYLHDSDSSLKCSGNVIGS